MRALALLLVVPLFAACLDDPLTNEVSHVQVDVEPSMAPDFSGMGETYPVLLVHSHRVMSEHERRAWENGEIVCLMTHDVRSREQDPCVPGPYVDAATGRIYDERNDPLDKAPFAVVVRDESCGGFVSYYDGPRTPSPSPWAVTVHDNGTFSVWDPFAEIDRWIRPGTSLKVGWYEDRGNPDHEEYFRKVFDSPGQWLVDRISRYDPDVDDSIPTRPEHGSGLNTTVPWRPEAPRAVVDALAAATNDTVQGLAELRLVHDGDHLTDVHAAFATDEGLVTWFLAGREGEEVRMLGRLDEVTADAVPLPGFRGALDNPWQDLRAGVPGAMTDVRLVPNATWSSVGSLLGPELSDPIGGCDGGCVWKNSGEAWRQLLAPQRGTGAAQATLQVVVHQDEPVQVWWHAPPKP